MNSIIKLKFGRYKNNMLKDVPKEYLRWCLDNKLLKGRAMLYAKQKLSYPKDRYKIEVEGAVIGNGTYYVEAYNKETAITQLRKEVNIKSTQSFCGTSFKITELHNK